MWVWWRLPACGPRGLRRVTLRGIAPGGGRHDSHGPRAFNLTCFGPSRRRLVALSGGVCRGGLADGGRGLALGGCVAMRAPAGPAMEAPGMGERAFTMPDGARLPYRAWLPEEPPRAVVLALHGFNDSRDAWEYPAPGVRRRRRCGVCAGPARFRGRTGPRPVAGHRCAGGGRGRDGAPGAGAAPGRAAGADGREHGRRRC